MTDPTTPPPADSPEFQAASDLMYDVFARDMVARGVPEAVPLLPQKLAPRHVETTTTPTGYKIVRTRVLTKFSSYTARYNARTGEQTSMTMGAFIKKSGRELTRDEAVDLAAALLKPPPDAQLDIAEYDEAAGEPFFVVGWSHLHQGARVEKDAIQALFNGRTKRIFSWTRRWHTISPEAAPR